jgi:hypothetical protein
MVNLAFRRSSRGCMRAEQSRGGIGSFVRSGLHLGAAEAVREQQKRE